MSRYGRLEAHIEIHTKAETHHEVFSCRPHHVSTMAPSKIRSVDVHEGQHGVEGSIVVWKYFHDGVEKVAKDVIEKIDDENFSTTYKVIEGDITKEYKDLKLIVKATPKGEYSLVHWVLEYERLNDEVADPFSLLKYCVHLSRDIDDHHVKNDKP